jgi:hypothetical protein
LKLVYSPILQLKPKEAVEKEEKIDIPKETRGRREQMCQNMPEGVMHREPSQKEAEKGDHGDDTKAVCSEKPEATKF